MRFFCILFFDDDVKDYVGDLTKDKMSGSRQDLDACKGRIMACYRLMLGKFIDKEVVVRLANEWTDPSTKKD